MHGQTFTLQGKVVDEQQQPIELVTVSVAKQGKMTMTSPRGEFSLTLHTADSVTVKFSRVGYKTKTRILQKP